MVTHAQLDRYSKKTIRRGFLVGGLKLKITVSGIAITYDYCIPCKWLFHCPVLTSHEMRLQSVPLAVTSDLNFPILSGSDVSRVASCIVSFLARHLID